MRIPAKRVLLLLFVVAGCNGHSSTASTDSIVGTYTLKSVNGSALPVVVEDMPTHRVEVLSGSVTLHENGTFVDVSTDRMTRVDGRVSTSTGMSSGIYAVDGATVTFRRAPDGSQYSMTRSGNRLTRFIASTNLNVSPDLTAIYER